MAAVVLRHEIEVVDTLTALGVPLEVLRDATLEGETHRDACTPFDPAVAPGFISYARTTRRLRELLVPRGWRKVDEENLALVVSPNGTMAIAVSTGDEGTGISYRDVKSKYPKGPATMAAVVRNRQLDLFGDPQPDPGEPASARRTWLLMRRRVDNKLFSELSLPQAIGDDGRVEEWSKRIILPPLDLEPGIDFSPDDGEDVVIEVTRR
jgi:hypothetical protein